MCLSIVKHTNALYRGKPSNVKVKVKKACTHELHKGLKYNRNAEKYLYFINVDYTTAPPPGQYS